MSPSINLRNNISRSASLRPPLWTPAQFASDLALWLNRENSAFQTRKDSSGNDRVEQQGDLSGNNNDAKQSTASAQPELLGSSVSYGAGDYYLEVEDSSTLDFNSSFSVSFWVYLFSNNSAQYLIAKRSGHAGYEIGVGKYGIGWFLKDKNGNSVLDSQNYKLQTNKWHHVVVTFDNQNNEVKRYLNNNKYGSTDSFGNISDISNNEFLSIGARGQNNDLYLDGKLGEVVLVGRVITAQERQKLFDRKP